MKIISQESSRVTILFPLEEIIPIAGVNGPDVISQIQHRYDFLKIPDAGMSREEVGKNGYKFGTGHILMNGKKSTILEFAIFTDGIVADAKNSQTAEAFLDDIINFLQSEHEFRQFSVTPKRFFHNQAIVEFERRLEKLIPAFEKISNAISKHLDPIYQIKVPMSFARLDLQVDKGIVPEPHPKFLIERRSGIPFERERYYVSAPMKTNDHIAVLEEIERCID